jgi:hypothetical protein
MSRSKLVGPACLAALVLAGCGSSAKPRAGRGVIDDPRALHVACLKQHHVPVVEVGQTGLRIGNGPGAATVTFASTPGAAQALQIGGSIQGAEVIGNALLYPNQAPDGELAQVETCLAKGVTG